MRQNLQKVRRRVGRNVEHWRHHYGWTQEQLAERVGKTAKHVGGVERGTGTVSIDLLTALAETFGVDVAELFRGAPKDTTGPPAVTTTHADFEQFEEVVERVRRTRARHRSK